jgi:hypothetical protein
MVTIDPLRAWLSNNNMQRTALPAAADAERHAIPNASVASGR